MLNGNTINGLDLNIGKSVYKFERYELNNAPVLKVYKNDKLKNHIRFTSNERREDWIIGEIKELNYYQDLRDKNTAIKKENKEKFRNEVKIGDVFVHSWGYDQTNVDFYQVIEKNGLRVKVQAIAGEYTENDGVFAMSGRTRPVVGKFLTKEPVLNKILTGYGIRFEYGGHASLWDGKRDFYKSSYC